MKDEFRSMVGGFQVVFENGYMVSVQFTSDHYCSNRNIYREDLTPQTMTRYGEGIDCPNAEVAVFDHNDNFCLEDQVQGWQTPEQVLEIMNRYVGIKTTHSVRAAGRHVREEY